MKVSNCCFKPLQDKKTQNKNNKKNHTGMTDVPSIFKMCTPNSGATEGTQIPTTIAIVLESKE